MWPTIAVDLYRLIRGFCWPLKPDRMDMKNASQISSTVNEFQSHDISVRFSDDRAFENICCMFVRTCVTFHHNPPFSYCSRLFRRLRRPSPVLFIWRWHLWPIKSFSEKTHRCAKWAEIFVDIPSGVARLDYRRRHVPTTTNSFTFFVCLLLFYLYFTSFFFCIFSCDVWVVFVRSKMNSEILESAFVVGRMLFVL